MSRYIVYENGGNQDSTIHDSYEEALQEAQHIRDGYIDNEGGSEGTEEILIAKVVERHYMIEDKEREEDPQKYGFDFWVKWMEEHTQ